MNTPHFPDSEKYLISVCIQNQSRIDDCSEAGIRTDSFYTPRNSILWDAMQQIALKGSQVDDVTIYDYLSANESGEGRKLIDLIGGPLELAQTASFVEIDTSFKSHIKRVSEAHKRRLMIKACQQSLEVAKDDSEAISEQIGRIEESILSVSADETGKQLVSASEMVDSELEQIKRINSREIEPGVKTGYADIDRKTGGLRNGEMIILAARPSTGKTALGMNIVENMCLRGLRCLVFSLEMSYSMLIRRMLFSRAEVNMQKINDGILTAQEIGRLDAAREAIKRADLSICHNSGINISGIQSYSRAVNKRKPLDFILIDYAQLIQPLQKSNSREQEVAAISMGIVQLRKQLNIPIMVLAQVNRQCEIQKRWPNKSDLRESGQLEQDADMILFLSQYDQDGNELPNGFGGREIDLIVAKNRNGPTGFCKLTFRGENTRFYNHAIEYYDTGGL